VRVVHGIPVSWGSDAAAATSRFGIGLAVWSPCNRFIAISSERVTTVDILDSATLERLQTLRFLPEMSGYSEALVFSPDSYLLTSFIRNDETNTGGIIASWDIQTGGLLSVIGWKGPFDIKVGNSHIAYLRNGTMITVISRYKSSTTISVYDVLSGVHMYDVDHRSRTSPDFALGTPYVYTVWTYGESLRFATPGPTAINIWEVGITPGALPAEVETLSIPDKTAEVLVFEPREQSDIAWTEFHPASCRLAFIHNGFGGTLLVWDARASKFLLHHTGLDFSPPMTFSSDGRFFACSTVKSDVYLWKESPTGYVLSEKFTPATQYSKPLLSPNGGSIITFGGFMIQLWNIKSFTSAAPSLSPQVLQHTHEDFVLEFLPDRPSAVATRKKAKAVTVLDLESGVPQLTIDTSMEVYGLRTIENTIVVIGGEKAITWDLPGGKLLPDARANVGDSIRKINFSNVDNLNTVVAASISSDFRYIALIQDNLPEYEHSFLDVYSISAGWNLRKEARAFALWFAPGDSDIWCAADDEAKVFTITKDALEHTKTITNIEYGSLGCPWGSSRGYEVTDEGWILRRDGKRLLMLPPLWQSRGVDRTWNGKVLALLHGGLPEFVILDLEP
jgi:WD40 repeat protein